MTSLNGVVLVSCIYSDTVSNKMNIQPSVHLHVSSEYEESF